MVLNPPGARPDLLRWLVKPLVWLACLAPAGWLLLRLSGTAGLTLGPNPVEAILDVLGKTALNLLLATLAVTPLRLATGWTPFGRLRRLLGLWAFAYALAHVSFYLVVDQGLYWSVLVEDVLRRPFITAGLAALLILVPLAATSTQFAMRALGRRWQRLHRAVYVAAALGVLHYGWQVKADLREPLVYAALLALLLGFRWWWPRRVSAG